MKTIAVIVDELPTKHEECMFASGDHEGAACCILRNDYCHLIKYGKCRMLFKESKREETKC